MKRARSVVPLAVAAAAWAVALWASNTGRKQFDADDIVAIGLAVTASFWALLDYHYRKFWRDTRKAKFENALASIAEGVRAEMHGRTGGDGQRAPGPRPKSS